MIAVKLRFRIATVSFQLNGRTHEAFLSPEQFDFLSCSGTYRHAQTDH